LSEHQDPGLRERLSRQGEEALGKLAEELVGNPVVSGALSRAFEAREKALQAQEAAMGALGIPSSADIERLTRRMRSVSQRLEGIEDAVDRLDERLEGFDARLDDVQASFGTLDAQLDKLAKAGRRPSKASGARAEDASVSAPVEARLEEISRELAALRRAVAPEEEPPPRAQERLTVSDG
jgi:chromosome segregation ATPase